MASKKNQATPLEKFFQKYLARFEKVVESDPFAKTFLSDARKAKTELYQSNRTESKKFDREWIEDFEQAFQHLDNIVRDPKRFLKEVQEIKPVELAKRVSRDSIRHLAQNSRYVKTVEANGDVVPSKILTHEIEDDYATYENRFIKTLIEKLVVFIEKRYQYIVEHADTKDQDRLTMDSNLVLENQADIRFKLELGIVSPSDDEGQADTNKGLMKRLELLRDKVIGFRNSEFMDRLKNAKHIAPPIMRTNLLTKNRDYKACYQLWQFIESYEGLGFSVEIKDSLAEFDQEYIHQLYDMFLVAFATFRNNKRKQLEFAKGKIPDRTIMATPKLIKKLQTEEVDYDQEQTIVEHVRIVEIGPAEIRRRKAAERLKLQKEKEALRKLEQERKKKEQERQAKLRREALAAKRRAERERRAALERERKEKQRLLKQQQLALKREQERQRKAQLAAAKAEQKRIEAVKEKIRKEAAKAKAAEEKRIQQEKIKAQRAKQKSAEQAKQKKEREKAKAKLKADAQKKKEKEARELAKQAEAKRIKAEKAKTKQQEQEAKQAEKAKAKASAVSASPSPKPKSLPPSSLVDNKKKVSEEKPSTPIIKVLPVPSKSKSNKLTEPILSAEHRQKLNKKVKSKSK